jgi:hypothetical protein
MAIFAGAAAGTNESAMLINQFVNTVAVPMIKRKNFFLFCVLGKSEPGQTPMQTKFERETRYSGDNLRFVLQGRLKTIATVADGYAAGAGETGTWVGTVIPSDTFGAVTFPMVHFADAEYFPKSEVDRFQGKEMQARAWVETKLRYLMDSFEDTVGTMLMTSTAAIQTRTQICPIRHQLSDGVSTGETSYVTYGLDRADSGNIDFRGLMTVAAGDVSLNKLRLGLNTALTRGGRPSLGLTETTLYTKIQRLAEQYVHTGFNAKWADFGADFVRHAGVEYGLEQRMATGVIHLVEPETFHVWNNFKNFTAAGIVPSPDRKASFVLNWDVWFSVLCKKPNSNYSFAGAT